MKPNVLLLSSVHPYTDPRIVYKIAPSMTKAYEVSCALPHACRNDGAQGVNMIWLPHFNSLIFRILLTHPLILWRCLKLRPSIVHIFVPELIPLAFLFQWLGANIVYEVQENMYKKFEIKSTNNARIYQYLFRYFDQAARRHFYFVFTDSSYQDTYPNLIYPSVVVRNFVSLAFTDRFGKKKSSLKNVPAFLYCGVISMERCFDTLISALYKLREKHTDVHVHLFGPVRFSEQTAEALPGYESVKRNLTFHGYTDLRDVLPYAAGSIAGIALLKPVADYPESYSTKLFEYMALNLPVITSDFPLYRDIVQNAALGFCISPYDGEALYKAMDWLILNPEGAEKMGMAGRAAAEQHYNWENEQKTLLAFYKKILVTKSVNI